MSQSNDADERSRREDSPSSRSAGDEDDDGLSYPNVPYWFKKRFRHRETKSSKQKQGKELTNDRHSVHKPSNSLSDYFFAALGSQKKPPPTLPPPSSPPDGDDQKGNNEEATPDVWSGPRPPITTTNTSRPGARRKLNARGGSLDDGSPSMDSIIGKHRRLDSIDETKASLLDPDLSIPSLNDIPGRLSFSCDDDDGWPNDLSSLESLTSSPRLESRKLKLQGKVGEFLARNSKLRATGDEKDELVKGIIEHLERERRELIALWKAELAAEMEAERRGAMLPALTKNVRRQVLEPCVDALMVGLSYAEVFLANMPLTIGAVGLSWVTMGIVWFKFMEEVSGFCTPVHFHSPRCHFGEFPGCFACDQSQSVYKIALHFHCACSVFAGICCMMFLLKVAVASRVVADELSNPATSTPCGVVCITMVCVFAGRGFAGECIVIVTSIFHVGLALWFLYMAIFEFRLWPDPGWYPNTVGISYAAIKMWLYFPTPGYILLSLCAIFFFSTFFISTARLASNDMIAAPICWIQLSAPSITMYALTLVSQPSTRIEYEIENGADDLDTAVHDTMVHWYLPLQHVMMLLSLIGLVSAAHALIKRWPKFSQIPFSPAHVAFCFPTLFHTNAVQAYRGAVNAYSSIPLGSPFKVALFLYWCTFLFGGTILNLIFTYHFIIRLPRWTKIDVAGEIEPPEPAETRVHEVLEVNSQAHEHIMRQPFISPAVLQANEAGALVRVRRGTLDYHLHGPYLRSRRVEARGFDPILNEDELEQERARLFDFVARNAPRPRHKTLSDLPILSNDNLGHRTDSYGAMDSRGRQHARSRTSVDLPHK